MGGKKSSALPRKTNKKKKIPKKTRKTENTPTLWNVPTLRLTREKAKLQDLVLSIIHEWLQYQSETDAAVELANCAEDDLRTDAELPIQQQRRSRTWQKWWLRALLLSRRLLGVGEKKKKSKLIWPKNAVQTFTHTHAKLEVCKLWIYLHLDTRLLCLQHTRAWLATAFQGCCQRYPWTAAQQHGQSRWWHWWPEFRNFASRF